MNESPKHYHAGDTPPLMLLIFSSIQHALIILSVGLALPVTISRTAGLDVSQSGLFMSIALFSIAITTVLQTMKTRAFGSGLQAMSAADGAALSACTMAAATGGMPLVYGMTIFSGAIKIALGSFTYRMRKLFPPEVTGSMIFILGISIIPTGVNYFCGTSYYEVYRYEHLLVASVSLLVMLIGTIFFQKLKPYAVLFGAVVGVILSFAFGLVDSEGFASLANDPILRLPLPTELSFSFDSSLIIPFLIVTFVAIIDNIGDYSAIQKTDDKTKKIDWKCIESGVRASGLGSLIAGFMGGVPQSTSTSNIGVAGATGVTSRVVAYGAAAILAVLSFFPQVMGALMLIPIPVLGAMLIFAICYIMAGGFATLASRELDDRKIFVVFLSIIFSLSTFTPSIWAFLPESVSTIIVSPLVMGVIVLIPMTLLVRIGQKQTMLFQIDTSPQGIALLNADIKLACQRWSTSSELCQKIQIGLDAASEGFHLYGNDTAVTAELVYDELQLVMTIAATNISFNPSAPDEEPDELDIALLVMRKMFDEVKVSHSDDLLTLKVSIDL